MSKYKFKKEKPCHILTEIYPDLFIGDYDSFVSMICKANVDVLVPLSSLDGDVWNYGFNGKILYYPVLDYDVLPLRILDRAVEEIIDLLLENKKVGIFCWGGHGRTGYLTACILGKLGITDPIEELRTQYCSKAIETDSQLKQISQYLNRPELYEKHKKEEKEEPYKDLYQYWGISDFYYNKDKNKEEPY